MSYIGRGLDKISNIEKLDAITFDGSQSYSLTKSSVAFTPNSANSLIISINGVCQFGNVTVSGTSVDFGVAMPSTDTNDFILHLGVGLVTNVADGAITDAKLGSGAVTSAKLSGALVTPSTLDVNGNELFLDADADTSITADTDDEIDFKTGGTDRAIITSTGLGIGNAAPSVSLSVGDDDDGGQGIVGKKVLVSQTLDTTYAGGTSGSWGGIMLNNNNSATDNRTATGLHFTHGTSGVAGIVSTSTTSQRADIRFSTRGAGDTVAERMRITDDGNVVAPNLNTTGSTSNRYPLYWVHTGTTGSIEPYTGSIRAMKTDIDDMGSVDWIHSLTPKSFKFRDYETDEDGNRTYLETTNDLPNTEYGLIAEEVNEVSGSDYILDKGTDKDGNENVKGVLYHNLVPVLLKAVQEQKTKIQELEARITTLENA